MLYFIEICTFYNYSKFSEKCPQNCIKACTTQGDSNDAYPVECDVFGY